MKYMVRPVRADEIAYLVELGKKWHEESLFRSMDFDEKRCNDIVQYAMGSENHFVYVIALMPEDVPVGGLFARLQDTFFGKDMIADDVLFFVEMEHRTPSVLAVRELLSKYKHWGHHKGASRVFLAVSSGIEPEQTAKVLDACGFTQVGTVHEA
jgi:hypothetical protein